MHFCRLGEVVALTDVTSDTLRKAQVGRKHWSSTVTVVRDWRRFKSLHLLVSSLASPRWLGDTFLIATHLIARRTSSSIFRNSVILKKWEHVIGHEAECSLQEPSGGLRKFNNVFLSRSCLGKKVTPKSGYTWWMKHMSLFLFFSNLSGKKKKGIISTQDEENRKRD